VALVGEKGEVGEVPQGAVVLEVEGMLLQIV
jgi:hypothetical protein